MQIVASIITIPPRVLNGDLQKCINGLLAQTVPFNNIYIVIPKKYNRFDPIDSLPDWFNEEPYRSKVEVLRPETDMGPIGKYSVVGKLLNDTNKNPFIFVGDDDQVYKSTLIEKMIEAIPEPKENYTGILQNRHEIVRYGSGGIIHGFVGLLVRASCLRALETFPLCPKGFLIDDQLLSMYTAFYNINLIPSKVIEMNDIYELLDNGHERGVGREESLHMEGNREKYIIELQKYYNASFIKGFHVDINWNYMPQPLLLKKYNKIKMEAPLHFKSILETINPSIEFVEDNPDVYFISNKNPDDALQLISSEVTNLQNNTYIIVHHDTFLFLEHYDIYKYIANIKELSKSGLKQISPTLFLYKVSK